MNTIEYDLGVPEGQQQQNSAEISAQGQRLCKNTKGGRHYRPVSEFTKNKSKNGGLEPYCKSCDSKRKREFYKKKKAKSNREMTVKFSSSTIGKLASATACEFGETIGRSLKELLESGKI